MNAKYSYKENLKITHGFVEGKLLQKNFLSLSFNNFLGNCHCMELIYTSPGQVSFLQ